MKNQFNYDAPAVQSATLGARQKELDAFEAQRAAYNDSFSRLMAEGGEVTQDDSRDKAARAANSVIKDFENYGYTKKEIMALADEAAAAGRGGDELLAYLSPESVELLKANGGSGTINPTTGLREFLSPILGGVSEALRKAIALDKERQAAADKAASDAAAATAAELEAARVARVAMNQEISSAREKTAKLFAPPPPPTAEELMRRLQQRDRMIATPVIGRASAPVVSIAQPSLQYRMLNEAQSSPQFQNTSQLGFVNPTALTSTLGPSADAQAVPNYSSRGVGAINSIGSANDQSPTMVGGAQNASFFTDRMGNQIYAPGMAPVSIPRYAKGGDVDLKALLAQNTETMSNEEPEEATNTNPVGTAQKMLADLGGAGQASPTRQAIRRVRTAPGGGATSDKAMQMAYEALSKGDLSAMKDVTPGARNTDSARAQMEELARIYQMKIRATQEKAKGLSADFFGAPTLEGQTLTKGKLTKKRFKDGGEAKKAVAESAKEPSIFSVSDYATKASARMFPEQMGQDDERDAARHMLAAAVLAKKTGPSTAVFLGKAHERMSNPESFFSMLGIGKPRDDYEMDVHNNRVGADLGSRATSQADLEKLVRAMALQAQTKKVEGKPYIMGREQMDARAAKAAKGMTPPLEYRAKGSPEEGETSITDQLIGAGETALTLGSGAVSSLVGLPYGLYKGLTSGKYLEGKAPQIADKEAAAFIERNTYVPRSQTGKENLEALGKITDALKLAPTPGGAAMASLARPKAVQAQTANIAKDFQQYNRQLSVPGASYAVRPTGSTTNMNNPAVESKLERLIADGRRGDGIERTTDGIENFWNVKARNYFEKQFGTPNDPVAEGLKTGRIKNEATQSTGAFPSYLTDQLTVGKTRIREGERPAAAFVGPGAPATRFFPKYPQAMEEFTARYDTATGLKGDLISREPGMGNETYPNMLSPLGETRVTQSRDTARDMLAAQGVRDELANPNIELTARSEKGSDLSTGYSPQAKALLEAYEKAKEKPSILSRLGLTSEAEPSETLSQSVLTAIEKGEPIYDTTGIKAPLKSLFSPAKINKYLETLPERELKNVRFEDVVQGANKMFAEEDTLKALAERIRSNKKVPDKVFSDGVSSPLLQFDKKSGFDGFAWKRLETPESTVPEGAYLGHSVGGYKLGGPTYSKEKMQAFKDGRNQVYTLRDNRNRPVTTVEVQMLDEFTPAVLQIKGNGRATGNVPAENYDRLVLDFFENYLNPVQISEKDALLTPLLQQYKEGINANFKMP
jgi:hypothetical protein